MTCALHRPTGAPSWSWTRWWTRPGALPWALAGACLSVTPTVTVLALARPVSAAASAHPGAALSRFALTASGAPLVASGTAAAGGGLLLTDQGAATVTGRLDSSPSAHTSAVAVEPGQTLRSLSASNGGPTAPGASAQYPGGPATSTDTTVGSTSAAATARTASATASAESSGQGATATETLSSDAEGDLLSATVTSRTGAVTIAGILKIGNVVGTAGVAYDHAGHHATATVSVTSATVAGLPVSIDSTGVHALGTTVVSGLGAGLPEPAAAVLAKAGVSISLLQPVRSTTGTGAFADSGALVVHVRTPDLTSGPTTVSSATDVALYLGRAQATLSDAPLGPPDLVGPPVVSPPPPASPASPVTPPVRTLPGPAAGGPPRAPSVAPPVPAPGSPRLLGHQIGDVTAFAALGTWQLLTLGIATLAAMNTRQRRVRRHLCPCPEQQGSR